MVFTGKLTEKGHARIMNKGKGIYLHRWFYENVFPKERIPEGLILMHTCYHCGEERHNPSCVIHTRIGTNKENSNDYDRVGENHHLTSIPDRIQRAIVKYLKENPSVSQAKMSRWLTNLGFQITSQTIGKWANGKVRQHSLRRQGK